MKTLCIISAFILFWTVFAIVFERDQVNAYKAADTRDTDSIPTSLRKIRYCSTYDMRTVKWRLSLVSAGAATGLLYFLIWRRLPSPSELITHILIITMVFLAVWNDFSSRTSRDVATYVDSNIDHIKEMLLKNHSFILPWTTEVGTITKAQFR